MGCGIVQSLVANQIFSTTPHFTQAKEARQVGRNIAKNLHADELLEEAVPEPPPPPPKKRVWWPF